MLRARNTPENYKSDIIVMPDSNSRKHGDANIPYASVKRNNGKKDVNFKMYFDNVRVTNYWLGKYDKYSKRSILLVWTENNIRTPEVVKFFEKLTEDVNTQLKVPTLRGMLGMPPKHVIKNPLVYDDVKKEHRMYATVSLTNVPKEDYGKYKVKFADDTLIDVDHLSRVGYDGRVTALTFEIQGKDGIMHIAAKLHEAIAVDLIENKFNGDEDIRKEILGEHGIDKITEAKRLLAQIISDSAESSDQKGELTNKDRINGDNTDDEGDGEGPDQEAAPEVGEPEPEVPVEPTIKLKKKKPMVTKFSAQGALDE